MFGINGFEIVILILVALFVVGPQRLPEYAAKLRDLVRSVRRMAEGAKETVKQDFGADLDEYDWKSLDPRQYDPRRIIREAWGDTDVEELLPSKEAMSVAGGAAAAGAAKGAKKRSGSAAKDEGPKRAPFDDEAT